MHLEDVVAPQQLAATRRQKHAIQDSDERGEGSAGGPGEGSFLRSSSHKKSSSILKLLMILRGGFAPGVANGSERGWIMAVTDQGSVR